MKLQPGATGFGCPKGQVSPDDIRSFVTACYDAARRTGGSVTAAREPGVTPTFHTVVISYEDVHIAVLRHDRLDVIALAQEPAHVSTLITAFIDRPAPAEILCQTTDCRILSAADLNSSLSGADLADLSADEHREVSYWQPATIGELLFNYWD
jgi:hypothetical protein